MDEAVSPPPPAQLLAGRRTELEKLGQRLFNDKRLSARGDTSCATCHVPARQFTDGLKTGHAPSGPALVRNTPSLLNVGSLHELFWDGRISKLDEQALLPLTNPAEHGLVDAQALISIVRRNHSYQDELHRVFGIQEDKLTIGHITAALAAYEQTLVSASSPFDRFEYEGDAHAMSAAASRGLELFRGRAQCATCHAIANQTALFTDQGFHMSPLGLPRSATEKLGALTAKVAELSIAGQSVELNALIETDEDISSLGRFVVTLNPRDIGLFKTPSLRNVALTAPYMHDGSVATLPEAIELELYSRTVERSPLVLTQDERADLLEFLLALTSR